MCIEPNVPEPDAEDDGIEMDFGIYTGCLKIASTKKYW
jgi:hypothetical protein